MRVPAACRISTILRSLGCCVFRGARTLRFISCVFAIGCVSLTINHFGLQVTLKRAAESTMASHHWQAKGKGGQMAVRPNESWVKRRQELLNRQMNHGRSKVILFSYMRGGSTLFSNIFNIDPNSTILWYEALDGFHAEYSGLPFYTNSLRLLYYPNQTRRSLDLEKVGAMTDYLSSLLNCQSGEIPIETLTHRFISISTGLKPLWRCTKKYNKPVFEFRQPIFFLVFFMEHGNQFSTHPHLRIVAFTRLARYFRKRTISRAEAFDPKAMFLRYLNQVEEGELKTNVYRSCGVIWGLLSKKIKDSNSNLEEFWVKNVLGVKEKDNLSQGLYTEVQCNEIVDAFWRFARGKIYMQSVDEQAKNCRDTLSKTCERKNLIVVEIHRASMSDLEPLIQRMPDVHIVFYPRDPRAVAVSRSEPETKQGFYPHDNWTAVNESGLLCRRMWDDLEAMKRLERKYPGSISTVRYEDFVQDPWNIVNVLYKRFMRKVPERFKKWVEETMNAGHDNGVYGIRRSNGMQHISKWRWKVSLAEETTMTELCLPVLKELGYDLFKRSVVPPAND